MKLAELKAGDEVVLDDGFRCAPPGPVVLHSGDFGLFFYCNGTSGLRQAGGIKQHFLCAQENFDGELIGISKK